MLFYIRKSHYASRSQRLLKNLSELQKTAQRLPTYIPEEVINYVEDARNPDIYTRQMVELVMRYNQVLKGRSEAFASFRDILGQQMMVGIPEINGDGRQDPGEGGMSDQSVGVAIQRNVPSATWRVADGRRRQFSLCRPTRPGTYRIWHRLPEEMVHTVPLEDYYIEIVGRGDRIKGRLFGVRSRDVAGPARPGRLDPTQEGQAPAEPGKTSQPEKQEDKRQAAARARVGSRGFGAGAVGGQAQSGPPGCAREHQQPGPGSATRAPLILHRGLLVDQDFAADPRSDQRGLLAGPGAQEQGVSGAMNASETASANAFLEGPISPLRSLQTSWPWPCSWWPSCCRPRPGVWSSQPERPPRRSLLPGGPGLFDYLAADPDPVRSHSPMACCTSWSCAHQGHPPGPGPPGRRRCRRGPVAAVRQRRDWPAGPGTGSGPGRPGREQGCIKAIVSTTSDGIVTYDDTGLLLSFNQAAAQIFQYEPGEVLGKPIGLLLPQPGDASTVQEVRTGEARIVGIENAVRGRRKDGTLFPMEVAIRKVRPAGTNGGGQCGPVHLHGHPQGRDREQTSTGGAGSCQGGRGTGLPGSHRGQQGQERIPVAHVARLRTPLNAILGFAQLLECEPLLPTQQASVQYILKGGRHLLTLINEVLEIARIESAA